MKLPSPEEYGKALAERRKKADKIPQVLKKLDKIAIAAAEQLSAIDRLPLSSILEAISEARTDVQELNELSKLFAETEKILSAVQDLQMAMISGLNALSESVRAIPAPPEPPPPYPEPADHSEDFRITWEAISKMKDDISVVHPEPSQRVVEYRLGDFERGEDGDITSAVVTPIYRH